LKNPRQLYKIMEDSCVAKMERDKHKDNPLERSFQNLFERQFEEHVEKLKAYREWTECKSSGNTKKVLDEIADEINFLLFQSAKLLEIQVLKRG